MNITIRVDASIQIGTGHVMRCLTLAEELRRRGCQVQFVCRAHPGHMGDEIAAKGFKVSLLPTPEQNPITQAEMEDYSVWLGVNQEEDAGQTISAMSNKRQSWIIVDHYGLDEIWEKSLRPHADKIMVIDDLANRKHQCDLLLDQNYFQEQDKRYNDLLPKHCNTLLGPKYALLRPEFRQARNYCRMRGNGVARVLIYFGGNDVDNVSELCLEALSSPDLKQLIVELVVGPNNPHLDKLYKQAQARPKTRLHVQPDSFIELMLRADLCIGAGGTTTWERLCLTLPSLVITLAANQEEFTKELDRGGYVNWLGFSNDMTSDKIRNALLAKKSSIYTNHFWKLPELVDGEGAKRVAETTIAT